MRLLGFGLVVALAAFACQGGSKGASKLPYRATIFAERQADGTWHALAAHYEYR